MVGVQAFYLAVVLSLLCAVGFRSAQADERFLSRDSSRINPNDLRARVATQQAALLVGAGSEKCTGNTQVAPGTKFNYCTRSAAEQVNDFCTRAHSECVHGNQGCSLRGLRSEAIGSNLAVDI